MTKRVIFEDCNVKAYHSVGQTLYTLVTFSNFGFDASRETFWGEQACAAEKIDAFGVVAKASNWFPEASLTQVAAIIKDLSSQTLVGYGHSQGAYAALKYSRLIGLNAVIACAPQFSIDPSIVGNFDTRFTAFFDQELNALMDITTVDLSGRLVLVYDPKDERDCFHINKIKSLATSSTVSDLPVRFLGHDLMEVLKKRDLLMSIIDKCLQGKSLEQPIRAASILKKMSFRYALRLNESLQRRSKFRTALAVLDRVIAMNHGWIEPRDQVPLTIARARSLLGCARARDAVSAMQLVMAVEAKNPHLLAFFGSCQMAAEDNRGALASYDQAVALRPGNTTFEEGRREAQRRLARG